MIKYAERFQNDTPTSILRRYPGSVSSPSTTTLPNHFPATINSYLQFGEVPFSPVSNTRLEAYIQFAHDVTEATTSSASFWMFGLEYKTTDGTSTLQGVPIQSLLDIEHLNIVIEPLIGGAYSLLVIADGTVIVPPTQLASYSPASWIGTAATDTNIGHNIERVPNNIASIIVATDTPKNTYITPSAWQDLALDVVASNDWGFSGLGYVQDVDKADPTVAEPNVFSGAEPSTLQYSINAGVLTNNVIIHAAVGSDLLQESLQFGNQTIVADALAPIPAITTNDPYIYLETRSDGGVSNNDGVRFLGEVGILYSEVIEKCGMTGIGTAFANGEWLKFQIDGKYLMVARTPVVYNVSWDQLYQKGLVYGIDGYGLSQAPTGPVNQLKIVEIQGEQYKVRLLKGCDTDYYTNSAGLGYDLVGTRNSEWSRLFYPLVIDDANIVSYDGPKIASYTNQDLGIMSASNGGYSWCQETLAANVADRVIRGYLGVSNLNTFAASQSDAYRGWRPVLEWIPRDKDTPSQLTSFVHLGT